MKGLRRNTLIALCSIYFLIFIGSLVRATGSGMGCPDWPKCYGKWIPPTSHFIPDASWYQEVFADREHKNIRLASLLESLGWNHLATSIKEDKSIYKPLPVNITKTWIEYINRLIGVAAGISILVIVVSSARNYKVSIKYLLLSVLVLFVTLFQGWIGSLVVSTHLIPNMVTVHMGLALLIVFLITLLFNTTQNFFGSFSFKEEKWGFAIANILLFGFLFVQLFLGLNVREQVDLALKTGLSRDDIIGSLSSVFLVHRSMSWIITLMVFGTIYYLWKFDYFHGPMKWVWSIAGISVVGEMLIGVSFQYLGFPAFAQPFHLLFACLLLGMTFHSLLMGLQWKVSVNKTVHYV